MIPLFYFSFFLERQMLAYFIKIMDQKCGHYVSVQLLQTLNILFENIRKETSLCTYFYFLIIDRSFIGSNSNSVSQSISIPLAHKVKESKEFTKSFCMRMEWKYEITLIVSRKLLIHFAFYVLGDVPN